MRCRSNDQNNELAIWRPTERRCQGRRFRKNSSHHDQVRGAIRSAAARLPVVLHQLLAQVCASVALSLSLEYQDQRPSWLLKDCLRGSCSTIVLVVVASMVVVVAFVRVAMVVVVAVVVAEAEKKTRPPEHERWMPSCGVALQATKDQEDG